MVSLIFVFWVINQYGINGQIRKLQKSSFIPPLHATHVLELGLEVTQCSNGLRCIHGYCTRRTKDILIWECVCDPGWVGLVCDQRVDSHVIPVDIPVKVPTISKLPESTTNDNDNTVLDNGSKETGGGTAESSLGLADGRHACDKNYIPRTFTERTCTLGLLCRFGTCFVDHQDTYIAYTCHCDEGAVGIFCEHKCCLDCGTRGSCQLFPNGTQFCNCDIGYQGSECQERQTHTLAYGTTQEDNIRNVIFQYKWVLIIGSLVFLGAAIITSLATYAIIKRRKGKASHRIWSLGCNTKQETLYNNNIIVWYHDNKEDTSLVKQAILPVLDRAKLSYLIYTQPRLDIRGQKLGAQCTGYNNEDFEENPEKLMVKGRHVIIVYTPDFIKSCSETDILLMRRYNKIFNKNKQLVYVCTRPSLEKLKTRLGYCCIFRLKTIKYPELGNTEAIRMFCEKFQSFFAKDNCCREETFKTIQDV